VDEPIGALLVLEVRREGRRPVLGRDGERAVRISTCRRGTRTVTFAAAVGWVVPACYGFVRLGRQGIGDENIARESYRRENVEPQFHLSPRSVRSCAAIKILAPGLTDRPAAQFQNESEEPP
jgi:hypothetical protein